MFSTEIKSKIDNPHHRNGPAKEESGTPTDVVHTTPNVDQYNATAQSVKKTAREKSIMRFLDCA
jgi:hypothetical protein